MSKIEHAVDRAFRFESAKFSKRGAMHRCDARNPLSNMPRSNDSSHVDGYFQSRARSGSKLRVREIDERDFKEVSELLGRRIGYPAGYFLNLLQRMRGRLALPGYPQYGRVLEYDGTIVGAIILIFSQREHIIQCHITGWAVEPAFMPLAALFFARDLGHKEITYLNLSARWSPHTVPIIEAQGFIRYSDGEFFCVPAIQFSGSSNSKATILSVEREPNAPFETSDRDILLDHASYGCISFWCVTPERAYPFIFRPRLFKRLLPGVQLIYCRDIADFVRFAGPIGRHLAWRGRYVVRIDANGLIPGLVGVYQHGVDCRYYKGPKPRLGDLAYTQLAMCYYVPRKKLAE
jgi:hypothetical protein